MNQHSLVLSGPFAETLGESPKAVEAWGPKSPSLSSSLLSCLSLRQAEQLGKAVREHLSRCCSSSACSSAPGHHSWDNPRTSTTSKGVLGFVGEVSLAEHRGSLQEVPFPKRGQFLC